MNISKETVFKIATKEAERLGFKVKEMIAFNPDNIEEWNDYYKKVFAKDGGVPETYATEWRKTMESTPGIADKLGGKDYMAVYFGPKKPMRGGDLWIFIDKDKGTVITHWGGK